MDQQEHKALVQPFACTITATAIVVSIAATTVAAGTAAAVASAIDATTDAAIIASSPSPPSPLQLLPEPSPYAGVNTTVTHHTQRLKSAMFVLNWQSSR